MKKIIRVLLMTMSIAMIFSTGCKKEEVIKVEQEVSTMINKVHAGVKSSLGELYIPDMVMEKEQLEDILGVPVSDLSNFVAELPMMSTHVDTFIGVGANEDNLKTIEEGLNKYREHLIKDTFQYPMNMAKIQASKVVTFENDVYFILLGGYDDRGEATEAEALEFAKNEVKKIEDIIAEQYK